MLCYIALFDLQLYGGELEGMMHSALACGHFMGLSQPETCIYYLRLQMFAGALQATMVLTHIVLAKGEFVIQRERNVHGKPLLSCSVALHRALVDHICVLNSILRLFSKDLSEQMRSNSLIVWNKCLRWLLRSTYVIRTLKPVRKLDGSHGWDV